MIPQYVPGSACGGGPGGFVAVQGIEAEHVVVCPWMFGGDVRATVIVPSAPRGPNRPVMVPLKVLRSNVRSSVIANGPGNRLSAGEGSVVRWPSLRTQSYRYRVARTLVTERPSGVTVNVMTLACGVLPPHAPGCASMGGGRSALP